MEEISPEPDSVTVFPAFKRIWIQSTNHKHRLELANRLNVLTNEGEDGGEDEKHPVTKHGECDGEVSSQASPNEELVHRCPVMGFQTQLEDVTAHIHSAFVFFLRGVFIYCSQ